jgi:hypothetical protein
MFTVTNRCPKVFTVCNVLLCGLIGDEMRYLKNINLPGGGVETPITTTLTAAQKPYSRFLLNPIAGGGEEDITSTVAMKWSDPALTGGVYVLYIYNGGADLTNVELRILY